MTVPWEILIVSSDLEARSALVGILNRQGIQPLCAATIAESRKILANEKVGLAFCDSYLSDGTYAEFLRRSHELKSKLRVVVTSGLGEWDEYLQAVRMGAFDAIALPCRPADVEWMVIQARREHRIRARQEAAIDLRQRFAQMSASGPPPRSAS
jgi:DNA-binding NtrC family response regulator